MAARKIFFGIVVILLLSVMDIYAESDSKYYSEYAFRHKLNDKIDLLFTPEFRMRDDMTSLYYYHWRLASVFAAYKNLDLSLAYRYIQTKDAIGQWDNNDTQYVEMLFIPKVKFGEYSLSDANKFERRFIENAPDRWVYRNLITLAHQAKIGNFEFTPYISNEIYYDFEIGKFNLNWATLGFNKKVNKYLTYGIYFRDETLRVGTSSKWNTAYILGSNITVDF